MSSGIDYSLQKHDATEQFIYLLLRDHVPAGIVASIFEDMRHGPATYTNTPLADIAGAYSYALANWNKE